ncbi:MAG: PVC-type heme-binding CxxCH protein [Rubripirellula sp.]
MNQNIFLCAAISFTFLTLPCSVAPANEVKLGKHQFQLPDGFSIQRIAGPPLVQRPMHMCFDTDGVLYVTDSSGNTDKAPVQLKDPQHRVLRLVDIDGDGVFDESSVFADKLPLPEGILVHDGAVYVGAPPHIWKLRDTDGDHVADQRTEWFDGGSIEGCGNDMHGPYLGPDGFFYWCKGAFAPQEHDLTNGRTQVSHAAHIYRARPDGSQLERVITGGMNNPVGLAFNETGERFLSGTFFDLSKPGRRDGILHAVYGGTYGRKNPRVLTPHPNTGGFLPVLAQLGPAAPSGMVMPRHGASGLKGDLILTEFNTRRVSRHQLAKSGSSHSAETSTFIESDQSDFHPTDVIEDADGSLLVADTGSWYMICCPTSKIAKPNVLGAIYRMQKKSERGIGFQPVKSRAPTGGKPIPPTDARGLMLDWNEPQVDWLADQRPAVVKRAIDALAAENNIDALRSSPARIPAVWTLHRIPGSQARAAVREFLSGEAADVRAAAIHSIALWRDRDALKPLLEIFSQHDPLLRRLAAMALGRIGDGEAAGQLVQTYSSEMDPFLSHAIVYALYEMGDVGSLPEKHPLVKQVRLMRKADQRSVRTDAYPKILPARWQKPNQEKLAQQERRLNELAAYLPNGDAKRGARLFNNQDKSKCTICHLKADKGVRLGPDLTWIGAIRSERDLLEAIVFPSASIARYHEIVNVLTKDGNVVSGLLVKETVDEMFLSSAEGVAESVLYRNIQQARYSSVSLMPDGLDKLLEPEEIADLVAFLKASKPAEGASSGDQTTTSSTEGNK